VLSAILIPLDYDCGGDMFAGVLTATWKVTVWGPRVGRYACAGKKDNQEGDAYPQDVTGCSCDLLRIPIKISAGD